MGSTPHWTRFNTPLPPLCLEIPPLADKPSETKLLIKIRRAKGAEEGGVGKGRLSKCEAQLRLASLCATLIGQHAPYYYYSILVVVVVVVPVAIPLCF